MASALGLRPIVRASLQAGVQDTTVFESAAIVMFHRIPYAEAKRRGVIQDQILEALTAGVHELDDVDYGYADRLIAERLDQISEC